MSWHRAGVLLLGAQSCLPVPGVPTVGGVGSVLLSMVRMGWKLCHVFRPYAVVGERFRIQGVRTPDGGYGKGLPQPLTASEKEGAAESHSPPPVKKIAEVLGTRVVRPNQVWPNTSQFSQLNLCL
uniref:Uncharacterized protein n=1 Tax=Oryza sativa subsp. japonica TaxID=39947 RepID=Q850T0_ORYSJ|nr:hypothetical protein [Oryza sativa Japonica Group]